MERRHFISVAAGLGIGLLEIHLEELAEREAGATGYHTIEVTIG